MDHSQRIGGLLSLESKAVFNTISLLSEGATIPFISRYRKERTGGLDEVEVNNIKDLFEELNTLEKRRSYILDTIKEQGKLTTDLKQSIHSTFDLRELEDIYLPFKPKRKTRASAAIDLGLEPLAKMIMKQNINDVDEATEMFVKGEVKNREQAINGAKDIIAEWISENKVARDIVRKGFEKSGTFKSKVIKGKESVGEKFKDYFAFEERISKCKSHRVLALFRGETEGFLKVKLDADKEDILEKLKRYFTKSDNNSASIVAEAIAGSYKRLLGPAIENEFRTVLKERADVEAIKVFSENLRQLLMGAPLGSKRILAIDPGFKSGCKLVCLDEKGDLVHNETIFPHAPQKQKGMATKKILTLINQYKIEAISIGNATAGRETEAFIKGIRFDTDLQVFVVNEAGASIYSASSVAREEFPQFDVTVRGAVSIGRRLMDPLAELVKIDPKSIGVGQYQHDVDQKKLKESLDRVVESCVNKVGVDLNTASKYLLAYVSGLGPQLAENIVEMRKEQGLFTSREELNNVPRMGTKAFEQCAGFLRIRDAKNPLDNSAVHPELYPIVNKIAKKQHLSLNELTGNSEACEKVDIQSFVTNDVGEITLNDLLLELSKPGRDPRKKAKIFEFAKGITSMDDLEKGMIVPGIVTNITNFGAFVDIGVKQDGLVHISNLANEYISNPADYVQLNQHVEVKVIDLDVARKRVGLSMKDV